MTEATEKPRTITMERDVPHRPEKVWRALTQPHLVAEWLADCDLRPEPDHAFRLRFDWGGVDCMVRAVEPDRVLSYTWNSGDLRSLVTWTLTPTATGTRLRMEQTGFAATAARYYGGARAGWPRFLDALEQTLARHG
jgi:uncharacterized protein YndB with AHSA1/START domain